MTETVETDGYVWQNNACRGRYQMTREGILRTDSPRGIWELIEQQSEAANP
jgi:hypothetical protein